MATYKEVKIGDFVYKSFYPQRPGKVINIQRAGGGPWNTQYTVKWIDGTTSTEVFPLPDFMSLIKDHEKKVQTHKKKLPLLEKL